MGFNVYKFNVNRHKTLNHHEIELQIYLCNGTVFLSGDFPFQFNVVSIGWYFCVLGTFWAILKNFFILISFTMDIIYTKIQEYKEGIRIS